MNILHLLSQNHLTGAEVYAVTLAHQQMDQGHQVYQLSNGFYFESRTIKLSLQVETKSKFTFIKNVLWLRNFIRKQNIQVIHTHSRAAVKLAYWATLFTKTAHISTVHGIQHASLSKKLHNQYGRFTLAVCENVRDHLINDFAYNKNNIKVLRNPVNLDDFYYIPSKKISTVPLKLAIVGRTTGPKKNRSEQVIAALKNFNVEITLIGGHISDLALDLDLDVDADDNLNLKIREINIAKLNSEIYSQYDLVVGSGRVCIESLLTGVKTIAFGEACYVGLITEKNFYTALESNFGDIHPKTKHPRIDLKKFIDDVLSASSKPTAQQTLCLSLSLLTAKEFSLPEISQKILQLYESAYFLKNYNWWIPILMFHKIPDNEIKSQHKIYVTKTNFEKYLQFFKNRGFTSLTFSELKKYRTGQKSFKEFPKKPLILTFDDGYKDNLENASPLLKKYNFKAQIFLLADSRIDQNIWDSKAGEPAHEIISGLERKKWQESAFEIGSHGFSHQKISNFNTENALAELTESKKILEKEFNVPVNVFAFTFGVSSENSAELAQKAGYDYAVNTDTGGLLIEEDPYRIFRVNIFPDENFWSLYKKTSKWYRKYYLYKRNQ